MIILLISPRASEYGFSHALLWLLKRPFFASVAHIHLGRRVFLWAEQPEASIIIIYHPQTLPRFLGGRPGIRKFSTLLRKGEGGFAETDSGCSRQHYIHKTLGSISHIFSRIVELAVKPYTALKLVRAITYLKHLEAPSRAALFVLQQSPHLRGERRCNIHLQPGATRCSRSESGVRSPHKEQHVAAGPRRVDSHDHGVVN